MINGFLGRPRRVHALRAKMVGSTSLQEVATDVANALVVANIAHALDGNLHPLIITTPGDEGARVRAQLAFEDILDDAIALGGTGTGENGVGLLKMRGMNKELGSAVLGMHHAVKAALDPQGILDPGEALGGALMLTGEGGAPRV
ncbi:FAD-linked oxidase C-terminal domain-containing protein [Streptomyces sp. NPDC001880]